MNPPGTSWMIFWVAGVWGVYRILPIRRGLMACHIILDMGLESILLIRLLQKGAGGETHRCMMGVRYVEQNKDKKQIRKNWKLCQRARGRDYTNYKKVYITI